MAVGISGAIQHLAGMKVLPDADTVAAMADMADMTVLGLYGTAGLVCGGRLYTLTITVMIKITTTAAAAATMTMLMTYSMA